MNDIQQALQEALTHHQAGRLGEAKTLYDAILHAQPGQPDAMHFLGLLACQLKQYDAGLALMERSLAERPDASYFNNLGNMLRECGRLDDAIAHYRRAVALRPDYPEAHNNLGNALRDARDPAEAMRSCSRAIELRPGYAEAYNNLGNVLQDLGELDAAAASYGKAIAFHPAYAEAHSNLGNVLRAQERHADAIVHYRRAIELNPALRVAHRGLAIALRATDDFDGALEHARAGLEPDDAEGHCMLGRSLRSMNDFDGAARLFERACEIDPGYAPAWCRLGELRCQQGEYEESLRLCRHAIELDPELADAYNFLGLAYHNLDRMAASELSHRHAIDLNPDDADAHHNLAAALFRLDKLDEAMSEYRIAQELGVDPVKIQLTLGDILWAKRDFSGAVAAFREAVEHDPHRAYARLLFNMSSSPAFAPEEWVVDAQRYGDYLARDARLLSHDREQRARQARGRPLRVGFVSGDLRQHPVGIFLESVLAHLDRTRIEPHAYVTFVVEDDVTARLKTGFASWKKLTCLNRDQAARMIHDDGIDVLVDLAGHTNWSGLPVFAHRPAPVQASWLGFFATTGCRAIDYFIGDPHTLPADEAHHFVEQPWHLPDSYLCFTPPAYDVAVGPLPMATNGGVTFGCFGKLTKISDDVIALWSRLLHALPDARLMLKAHELGASDLNRATLERFARHGIGAHQLILEGGSPRAEYFNAYNRIDIALSPFPYPGGTTTAEALWMGVPVIGMKGGRFVTHICESLLHAAGMGDWIAADEDAYLAKAIAFAGDRDALAALRATLRERTLASPLCDAARFARNLEDAFHGMWARYVAGDTDGART
ncbi:tetratricopeptide repeat family protein [Burkholderia ambifaria AMMD]|uniref:protein O-GlcNAc transferase n=1 Tax=Burkholderia ambifaria (strain ATCC BAA-244 / DSM 16087 / CCUG 44356 / LMG 19182 / AMMD) TaxID=339670 RepID=Q0BJG0_BURCM|nr:tetratricopeptide repeat protein [Burkholderia ambifaria]ABI85713.1 Tetratricopeptide TPR_2 repeat protein [Burkholderia ambifaria AMMD]AJY22897.1 tetratricopeptide repeat family protein [Burkholderia ambifaria AMMD]MBR7934151.1 tetratricopeptide repeat protein [Burkholderia ambifaria]PEH66948.1 glycosyltransferase [Burkholderia ambifaria]QQC03923.1 tetratricopeptide repeat protein [Burkholderia ambifaria]